MRRILLIAKRDYLAVVRTKAFTIGLVAFPVLFGGGSVAAALLQERSAANKRVAILDRTGISAVQIIQAAKDKMEHDRKAKNTGFQITPHFDFETVAPDDTHLTEQRLELTDRLRRGDITALIEIPPDAVHPKTQPSISYFVASGGVDASQPWLAGAVNDRSPSHPPDRTGPSANPFQRSAGRDSDRKHVPDRA